MVNIENKDIAQAQSSETESLDKKDPILTRDGFEVVVKTELTAFDADSAWQAIQDGFAAINARSAHRQDMTREEFEDDINNSNVLKFLAYDGDGVITGYLTVHIGIEKIVWADKNRLDQVQNEVDKSATPYYISTFVVPPSLQGLNLGGLLLEASYLELAARNNRSGANSVAFFDCAEENYPGIPKYAEKIAEKLTDDKNNFSVFPVYEDIDVARLNAQGVEESVKIHDEKDLYPTDTILDRQRYFCLKLETHSL